MRTAALLFAVTLPALARAELPAKAPIVPGAEAMSEPGRYKVARSFDDAVDYYQRLFKTEPVRWHNVVNQPGIKAKHVASLRKTTEWEGLNIYEHQGEVRVFVVTRPVPKKAAKSKAAKVPPKATSKTP